MRMVSRRLPRVEGQHGLFRAMRWPARSFVPVRLISVAQLSQSSDSRRRGVEKWEALAVSTSPHPKRLRRSSPNSTRRHGQAQIEKLFGALERAELKADLDLSGTPDLKHISTRLPRRRQNFGLCSGRRVAVSRGRIGAKETIPTLRQLELSLTVWKSSQFGRSSPSRVGEGQELRNRVKTRIREEHARTGGFMKKTIRFVAFTFLVGVASCTVLQSLAQAEKASYPTMAPLDQYMIPDRASEIALARSAAPKSISGAAEVLVLGRDGYTTAVKGTNGFVCMAQRSLGSGH